MTTDTELVAASDSGAEVLPRGRSALRYVGVAAAAAPALLIITLVVPLLDERAKLGRMGYAAGWPADERRSTAQRYQDNYSLYRSVSYGSRRR